MTTLSTLPTYPVPGLDVQLSFALTESGSNYLRVWVTNAPEGSELKKKLDADNQHRVHFYDGDAKPFTFKPDKGGVYKLLCQEYVKGTGYGGAYENDPNGAPSETKVGSEVTVNLTIGQRVTQTLGYGADTATLVWWVFGDYVRATTLATHGEASPAVTNPTSLRASIAANATFVPIYVADSIDKTVATCVGDISAIALDIASKLGAHQALGASVHATADTLNPLPVGLANSIAPKNLADVVNRFLAILRAHYSNVDSTNGTGEGSVNIHTGGGGSARTDRTNMPIVESVGDLAQAYAALGDIYRSYEDHRISSAVHGSTDGTNGLNTPPNLVWIHRHFFAALASLAPTAPPNMNSGVVTAVSIAGFTES